MYFAFETHLFNVPLWFTLENFTILPILLKKNFVLKFHRLGNRCTREAKELNAKKEAVKEPAQLIRKHIDKRFMLR